MPNFVFIIFYSVNEDYKNNTSFRIPKTWIYLE